MEFTVLGLGSNKAISKKTQSLLPLGILHCACKSLRKILKDMRVSSVYKTAALYYENQADFYNMAVAGYYSGSAHKLLAEIHAIEKKFLRNRHQEFRNGPRTLDIDIEIFGLNIVNTEKLIIPHKKLQERAFILKPMLEILPDSAEVIDRTYFATCLAMLEGQEVQKIFST